MKKIMTILFTILVTLGIMFLTSFSIFAEETELTPDQLKAFITRDEFNAWQTSFIASLSELDYESTSRIYDDMEFYDMQYKFTETYKQKEYMDEYGHNTPTLEQMIYEEKAKRGLL